MGCARFAGALLFLWREYMDELVIVISVKENVELIKEANELLSITEELYEVELKNRMSGLVTKILEYIQNISNPIVTQIREYVNKVPREIQLVYYNPEMEEVIKKLTVRRDKIAEQCNFNIIQVERNAIKLYNQEESI